MDPIQPPLSDGIQPPPLPMETELPPLPSAASPAVEPPQGPRPRVKPIGRWLFAGVGVWVIGCGAFVFWCMRPGQVAPRSSNAAVTQPAPQDMVDVDAKPTVPAARTPWQARGEATSKVAAAVHDPFSAGTASGGGFRELPPAPRVRHPSKVISMNGSADPSVNVSWTRLPGQSAGPVVYGRFEQDQDLRVEMNSPAMDAPHVGSGLRGTLVLRSVGHDGGSVQIQVDVTRDGQPFGHATYAAMLHAADEKTCPWIAAVRGVVPGSYRCTLQLIVRGKPTDTWVGSFTVK